MRAHVLLLVLCALCLRCHATNYTWLNPTGGGSWDTSANWSPAGVPAAGDTAIFVRDGICEGIQNGAPSCPLTLPAAGVTVTNLIVGDGVGVTFASGSLTVTQTTYLGAVSFSGATIVTHNTEYVTGDDTFSELASSTWTLQGNTTMTNLDWTLTASHVINQGSLNVTYYASLENEDADFSLSSFANEGSFSLYDAEGNSRIQTSFSSSGTFNLVTGYLSFFGNDFLPAKALTTSWSGAINVYAGTTLNFYSGQHTFESGLAWNVNGLLDFEGVDGAASYMNVTFDLEITIKQLSVEDTVSIAFNHATTLLNFDFTGGIITGPSKKILIMNMTGGCEFLNPSCPTFSSNAITLINGTNLVSEFWIDEGTVLQINGTVSAVTVTFTYPEGRVGGQLIINPTGVLQLYAFDDALTERHFFYVPLILYGRIQALPPQSGFSCVGQGILTQILAGGTIAGTIDTIYCGNNADEEDADVEFAGLTNFVEGFQLTGAGSFQFLGSLISGSPGAESKDKIFNVPYTFTTPINIFADVVFIYDYDLYIPVLIWNGGVINSDVGATITLGPSPNHIITGEYSYKCVLDGGIIVNNGAIDATDIPTIEGVNGAMIINNLNFTGNDESFESADDDSELIFVNNNNFITIGGVEGVIFTNNGSLISTVADASTANDIRFDGANVTFLPTSVVNLNLYGNAQDYGDDNEPYDQLEFFDSDLCIFGGTLVLNFVQPAKIPGTETTPYVPVEGELYPLISMPEDGDSAIGGCECQFANIRTVGLDTTKFSVGLQYDASAGEYEAVLVNLVICKAGDAVCAVNLRIGAYCSGTGSSTSPAATAHSSGASTSPASGSSTSPAATSRTSGTSGTSHASSTSSPAATSHTSSTSPAATSHTSSTSPAATSHTASTSPAATSHSTTSGSPIASGSAHVAPSALVAICVVGLVGTLLQLI